MPDCEQVGDLKAQDRLSLVASLGACSLPGVSVDDQESLAVKSADHDVAVRGAVEIFVGYALAVDVDRDPFDQRGRRGQ
jgi:hypothetical protein